MKATESHQPGSELFHCAALRKCPLKPLIQFPDARTCGRNVSVTTALFKQRQKLLSAGGVLCLRSVSDHKSPPVLLNFYSFPECIDRTDEEIQQAFVVQF